MIIFYVLKTLEKGGSYMWKNKVVKLTIFLLAIVFVGTGVLMAQVKGNQRRGKYLFRNKCRICHKEGAQGEHVGKPLSPSSKTQAQWKKYFEKDKHKELEGVWEKFSEEQLQDILAYLYNHAYDSPSPATCQ